MNGYHSKRKRSSGALSETLSRSLSIVLGLASGLSLLLVPRPASADQPLEWARIDFLRNRVQLVPREQRARRARISDVLSTGDALRTARSSRAELRFSDGSLARIGERATFRFTPNTRNFQLTNGTVLLLIPPERGRSTIQTPNAVTGIQGSALFVRYIPETDTTIVGALTNNPDGPMVLFNRDGTEQQALRANEIGVIQGDQITQLYQFDGELFWQSSGLAEGFNYLNDSSSTGSDALDAVRQEIREAIADQRPLSGEGVIENPGSFSRPLADEAPSTSVDAPAGEAPTLDVGDFEDDFPDDDLEEDPPLEFEDSPAAEYLNSENIESEDRNALEPAASSPEPSGRGDAAEASTEDADDMLVDEDVESEDVVTQAESETLVQDDKPGAELIGESAEMAGPETAGPETAGETVGSETADSETAGSETPTSETPTVVASPTPANPNATPNAVMDAVDGTDDEDGGTDSADPDAGGGDVEVVDVEGDTPPDAEVVNETPDVDAPETGNLTGEGNDPSGGAIFDEPTGSGNDNTPGDTADIPGADDGLILLEEESELPGDSEVVPITIPGESDTPEIEEPTAVEGFTDEGVQQEVIEPTVPEIEETGPDAPPVNDVPPVNDAIEVPNEVPNNDATGVDAMNPTPFVEVTTPQDSIETPVGGLSAEPLPQEVDAADVPLVAPMDEIMNEVMDESTGGSMGAPMGNGMDDMTDVLDAVDGGTPDVGDSVGGSTMGSDDIIPGTVPVPSTNTPSVNTPPEGSGGDIPNVEPSSGGGETPSEPVEAPRGTV